MDYFTKKIKLGYPKLEFVGDRKILPTCVILAFEAKKLLHKGCKAYLAHVIDKSTLEINLENVSVVCEFPNVFPEDLMGLPLDKELELE